MTAVALRRWSSKARRADKLLLAIGAILGALFLVSPVQGRESLLFTLESLAVLAPALLLAIGVGAWVKAANAEGLIGRVFQGHVHKTILFAALFGALSPFCSCGVIPIVLTLLKAGVPLAPVMAFWLSSPLMDPQLFFIISGTLGVPFALVKIVSAIAIALMGGYGTLLLTRANWLQKPLRQELAPSCGCSAAAVPEVQEINWAFWGDEARRVAFRTELFKTAGFLLKIMVLAFILESLMLAWVPADLVADILGGESIWAIPVATLVGVPAYLNSLAAVPLVAGLMEMGMAPGAALAFLTAGAISSIPAAAAVFSTVRRNVFAWYLLFALIGSILVGVGYQFGLTVV